MTEVCGNPILDRPRQAGLMYVKSSPDGSGRTGTPVFQRVYVRQRTDGFGRGAYLAYLSGEEDARIVYRKVPMLPIREILHPSTPVRVPSPFVRRPTSARLTRPCVSCSLKGVCLPCGLDSADIATFSILVHTKLKIARGGSLFRAGEAMGALYIVHSGGFKTLRVSREGGEKVTGFSLAGGMLGLDAINARTQRCEARALEDSEVCVVPFEPLQHMAQAMPALQQQLLRVLSDDISRDQGLMLLLGGMRAEQRLAAFLLSLARRYRRLGYAPDRFVLHMTRDDIGSYIGLAPETISRLLTQFQRDNLVSVHQREVRLTDPERLTETLGVW